MADLLALDLASNVGFARWRDGDLTYGSYRLPSTGPDVGRFLDAYHEWLCVFGAGVEFIVYEAPWIGPDTHQDTARKLLNLSGHTEWVARRFFQATCSELHNMTVRKFFIGTARGGRKELKRACMAMCERRGWHPKDDDAADALACLDYAMSLPNVIKAYGLPPYKPQMFIGRVAAQ